MSYDRFLLSIPSAAGVNYAVQLVELEHETSWNRIAAQAGCH